MALHLLAYTSSVAAGSNLVDNPALADQVLNISGNDFFVPEEMPNIYGLYCMGLNLTRAQMISPSMRRIFNEELGMLDAGAAIPSTSFKPWLYFPEEMIPLEPDELLKNQVVHSNVGAQRITSLVWLADVAPQQVSMIDSHSVRVTSTTAAVANAWSLLPLTFDQSLPAGQWELLGARLRSTNLQAFRFAFRGGGWRPGFIGSAAVGDYIDIRQHRGRMGVLGTFRHNLPPQIEVLCNGADASFAGELQLRYIGP